MFRMSRKPLSSHPASPWRLSLASCSSRESLSHWSGHRQCAARHRRRSAALRCVGGSPLWHLAVCPRRATKTALRSACSRLLVSSLPRTSKETRPKTNEKHVFFCVQRMSNQTRVRYSVRTMTARIVQTHTLTTLRTQISDGVPSTPPCPCEECLL